MTLMRLSRIGCGMDSACKAILCNVQESGTSLASQLADTLRTGVERSARKLSFKGPIPKPGYRKLVLSSSLLAPLDHLLDARSDSFVSSSASTSTSSSRSSLTSTRTPGFQYADRNLSHTSFDRQPAQLDAAQGRMKWRKDLLSASLPKRQQSLPSLMHQGEPEEAQLDADAARGMESRKNAFSALFPKRQLSLPSLMHQGEPGECNCIIPSKASSFKSRDIIVGTWLPIHGDKMKTRIERKFKDMQRLHEKREAEAVFCELQPKPEELFNVDAFVPSKTRKSSDDSVLSLAQHCDRLFSDIMSDVDYYTKISAELEHRPILEKRRLDDTL